MKKLDTKKGLIYTISAAFIILLSLVYIFKFRTCTVTFETKLGAGIKTQELRIGEKVEKPEDPIFDNYKFIGWFKDGKEYDFNTPIKKSITLEAKWEKINK